MDKELGRMPGYRPADCARFRRGRVKPDTVIIEEYVENVIPNQACAEWLIFVSCRSENAKVYHLHDEDGLHQVCYDNCIKCKKNVPDNVSTLRDLYNG